MLSALSPFVCVADNYSDLANYDAGKSLAWFYNLRTDAQIKNKADDISEKSKQISAILNVYYL